MMLFLNCVEALQAIALGWQHKNVIEAFAYPKSYFQNQNNINLQPNLLGHMQSSEISQQS